jgi:hypothetical protein
MSLNPNDDSVRVTASTARLFFHDQLPLSQLSERSWPCGRRDRFDGNCVRHHEIISLFAGFYSAAHASKLDQQHVADYQNATGHGANYISVVDVMACTSFSTL